jgi:hypothetical protein
VTGGATAEALSALAQRAMHEPHCRRVRRSSSVASRRTGSGVAVGQAKAVLACRSGALDAFPATTGTNLMLS